MFKIIILTMCLIMTSFNVTHSLSIDCLYSTSQGWGSLGNLYQCSVQNSGIIISSYSSLIDSVTGNHKAGYSNDNVEIINANQKFQYMPRGLNKFFKNIKGIQFYGGGLKEVHQNDLKEFPNLRNLFLYSNELEILEENLFEFNPNLDRIYLKSNKISHIDPNVFDKLTKLSSLYLEGNTCISKDAVSSTEVQNLIATLKSQCTNSEYSNLEQKVKNLVEESKTLELKNLKEKLENLEIEVKNSKFHNFFKEKLQDLKTVQEKKTQDEIMKKIDFMNCSALEPKVDDISANVKHLKIQIENGTDNRKWMTIKDLFSEGISILDEKLTNLTEKVTKIEANSNISKDTVTTLKDIEASISQNFAAIMKSVEDLDKKMEEKLTKSDENISNLRKEILNLHKEVPENIPDTTCKKSEITKLTQNLENFNIKLEVLEENLSNLKTFTYKKIEKMEIEEKVFHASIKKSSEKSIDEVEKRIGKIEDKIERKFDEIGKKFEEIERNFEEKLEKILGNLM